MPLEVDVVPELGGVTADEWNALAPPNNPFLDYAFLRALETSESVGAGTGWEPCHVLVRNETGKLVGAMPLYAKTHSYGEYIFDWAWANAAFEAGIPYFPKLVSAVPFTPATGRRMLVEKGATSGPVVDSLIRGLKTAGQALNASSSHILYLTAEEQETLSAEHQLMPRLSYQFHWENQGWESFDAYIASFRRSARRNVLKERQKVRESGLTIRMFEGAELEPAHWDALWSFYMGTASRKGAIPYLTRAFFEELRGNLTAMVMVGMALDGGHPVAGTLSLTKGTHLYGRYWGTEIYEPGLHFELCYYQHIEACIARGWTRFEAGAQGQHKLKRGLLPSPTYSVHWIRNPSLADAVSRFLDREKKLVIQEMAALVRHSPFKRDYPQA